MKISIKDIARHENSIAKVIEAKAQDSDTIASGIIGPSFATSGPGAGWSHQYDVHDYAERALDDDYGATRYIDSEDGREATLNDEGEVEWSEESVIELLEPSVEDCMDYPKAWTEMLAKAETHGADFSELEVRMAAPYEISDGNATEYASTLAEAESTIEDWYDYLVNDGKLNNLPSPELDVHNLDTLQTSIREWEERIAEVLGSEAWAGHDNYYVSAADRAGLRLRISIRD